MLVFLLPTNILAHSDEGWDEETIIDVSIVGEPVINLDSSNTLLRVYVDITNFDPSDGYYYLSITQSATDTIISQDEIVIREKSNGKAGADVAHMVTEDELSHTGTLQGIYDVLVYTESGTATGNATFSIIKPSDPIPLTSTELFASNETSTEIEESIATKSSENESELINTKKIPEWVKNIFVLYSYDEITENELINALTYLIEQGIIEINQ
jgi:hypothetical protein